MDEYRKIVTRLAASKENIEIPNTDAAHAAFLISTFFLNAEKEICLFTNELHESVYGNSDNDDIRSNIVAFLKRPGTLLRIAYQKSIEWEALRQQSELLKFLLALPKNVINDKLKVYNASKLQLGDARHFALMDSEAYRYELDHEKRTAVANFGDVKNAKKLSSIFETIVQKSEAVFAS